jgi:hypothetical protein
MDLMLRFCDSRAIGRHFRRKNDADGGTAPKLTLRLDSAPVQLGDMLHNRETKASPAEFATARFVRAIKSLKDPRQIFMANSDTVVAHAKHGLVATTRPLQTNLTIVARIFNRVIKQIIENFA